VRDDDIKKAAEVLKQVKGDQADILKRIEKLEEQFRPPPTRKAKVFDITTARRLH
jgi:hypothetical protein